jgi:hypothetical protein
MNFAVTATALLLIALPVSAAEPDPGFSRAASVLAPFKRDLMAALTEGLAKGPENALDVCRVRAPDLAAAASTPVIDMGRTSHKLRSPANAPRAWVKPLLDAYVANPADRSPRLVDLPDGHQGYVEPIFVQPMCTACHGTQVAAPVKARIDSLYPADQATGFMPGDFRGLFWIEFKRP